MTAVVMMVVVAARRKGGNRVEELGGVFCSGKIQFLQLYCSVCHHSLSRLNTRAE